MNTKKTYSILIMVMFYSIFVDIAIGQDTQLLKAVYFNDNGVRWQADLTVEGKKISGILTVIWNEKTVSDIKCKKVKVKAGGKFKLWCKGKTSRNRSLSGNLEAAKLSASGAAGGAQFQFVSGDKLESYLLAQEQNPKLTTNQFLMGK